MHETGTFDSENNNDRLLLILGLLVALLTGYYLFFHSSELGVTQDSVRIGTLRTDRSVRNRHARTLNWGNLSGEGAVYVRDIIYTPKNTYAEFVWAGDKKIILEPESMVQFDEVSLDRMEIVLMEGRIKTDPSVSKDILIKKAEVFRLIPAPKSQRSFIGDISVYEIKQSEISDRLAKVIERKIEMEPMLNVQSPTVVLNRVSDYNLLLTFPTEQEYNAGSGRWIGMKWVELPLDDVEYSIAVAKDSGFRSSIFYPTKRAELAIQFDGLGQFYWKVKAAKRGDVIESDDWNFEMVEKGGVNLSPRNTASSPNASKKSESTTRVPKPPALPKGGGGLLLGP